MGNTRNLLAGGAFHVELTVSESGVGEAVTKGESGFHGVGVVPTIAEQTSLSVVGG